MRTMAQPRCSGSHPTPSSPQSTSSPATAPRRRPILAFDADDIDVELPHNVDLIPSSRALQNIDTELARTDIFYNPNECLHGAVKELKALKRYDYIFIDTGPQASPTTRSAYLVSDYFILSLVPEKLAVDSLPDALQDIAHARRPERNPKLHLLGLILSCMDRRVTLAKRYEDAITQRFKQADEKPVKFATTIGRAAAINRAAHEGKTILQTEPNHRVSHQYRNLSQEVETRIVSHQASLRERVAPIRTDASPRSTGHA